MIPREIIRQVRRIEIRSRFLVDSLFGGNYLSVFKGRGLEFAGIRDYVRGDDYRSIDWKVSARTGRPHVKTFHEERHLTVELLFDLSASVDFGTRSRRKRTLAAEFAATVAFSAVANQDQVGLTLFSDRVEKCVPPGKGRMKALRILRDILYTEAEGQGTDLTVPLSRLMRNRRQKSVVFLLSDFLHAPLPPLLKSVRARHDLIPVILRDPFEQELPDAGWLELRDLESGDVVTVNSSDPRVRDEYRNFCRRRDETLIGELRALDMEPMLLSTAEPHERSLLQFFRRREQAMARRH